MLNSLNSVQVWNACGYVRLSHEDGDKEESNSITGQKDLIRDYFRRHPELTEYGMKVDDGFSGSSFERPAFLEMMEDVKAGKVNCIIVKDLSRFGRNYLDAGEYIERVFPFMGVRFIAINDNYDSLHSNPESDALVIPFKNLINEAYCRDISIKIRSQLAMKRKRGDFTGAFAVYGYLKDPENKNHLIVDEYAADVVRDMFRWKLAGVSAGDIAQRLNKEGILSPMDYKKSLGIRYSTPFCAGIRCEWTANAVLRILKNPVYIGILEQGKNTTPSYKVKRRIRKPRGEWDVVKGTHEGIVDGFDFEVVQKVLLSDTRTSPGNEKVEVFSGMVFCGECGGAMIRKTIPSGKKKYVYYVCAAHKNEKVCFPHSLRDIVLNEIILESVRKQIQDVIDLESLLLLTEKAILQKAKMQRFKRRLEKKQEEVQKCRKLLYSLYENLAEGIIDKEEYRKLKMRYSELLASAEEQAEKICMEISGSIKNGVEDREWIGQFKKYRNITELDRTVVVTLIERILVYRDKRIEIVYNWHDEFRQLAGALMQAQGMGVVSGDGTGNDAAGKEAI